MSTTIRRSTRSKPAPPSTLKPAPPTTPKPALPKPLPQPKTHGLPAQHYNVNDFVMLRSDTLGEPYFLGRIMEFPDSKHVRIAWFYRPQDVLSKTKPYPPRLVVASMHSDVNPIRAIVDKCHIQHISEIADVADFVSAEKNYYYSQLFDRFTKRVYDVVPSHTLHNRPPHVLAKLTHFPFILVEEGRDKELKSHYQECRICGQWVPQDDALACFQCHSAYHSACLSSVKKPRTGYQWLCHFCATNQPLPALENDVDSTTHICTLNNGHSSAPTTPTIPTSFPWTYFGIHCSNNDAFELDPKNPLYPRISSRIAWRYQATIPKLVSTTAASNTPIETSARARPSRRALVKKHPSNSNLHSGPHLLSLAHTGLAVATTNPGDYLSGPAPPRGDGSGLVFGDCENLISSVDTLLSKLDSDAIDVPVHSNAFLDRMVFELHHCTYNADEAFSILSQLSADQVYQGTYPEGMLELLNSKYPLSAGARNQNALHSLAEEVPWINEDRFKFIRGVELHGFDLYAISRLILPDRPVSSLVLYLYQNKKHPELENALHTFLHGPSVSPQPTSSNNPRIPELVLGGSPSRSAVLRISRSVPEDSSDSEAENIAASKCTLCHQKSPSKRYTLTNVVSSTPRPYAGITLGSAPAVNIDGPRTVTGTDLIMANPTACHVLCEACGQYWMRYGGLRPLEEEEDEEMSDDEFVARPAGKHGSGNPPRASKRSQSVLFLDTGDLSDLSDVDDGCVTATTTNMTSNRQKAKPVPKRRKVHDTSALKETHPYKASIHSAPSSPQILSPIPPPPPPVIEDPEPCAMCLETEMPILRCSDCNLNVHESCYRPVSSASSFPSQGSSSSLASLSSGNGTPHDTNTRAGAVLRKWRCGSCMNQRNPTESLVARCVVCPREYPLSPAWPMKRTVHHNWVHAICAMFIPELKADPESESLEPIRGIQDIPPDRWSGLCALCQVPGGLCICCAEPECGRLFHVSCAHRSAYLFGLVEESVGGQPTGVPAVWCRHHLVPDHQFDASCKHAIQHTTRGGCSTSRGRNVSNRKSISTPRNGLEMLEIGEDPFPPLIDWKTKKGERFIYISRQVMDAVIRYVCEHKRAVPSVMDSNRHMAPILTGQCLLLPPTPTPQATKAVMAAARASMHSSSRRLPPSPDEPIAEPTAPESTGLRIKLKLGSSISSLRPTPTSFTQGEERQCDKCSQPTSIMWWPAEMCVSEAFNILRSGDAAVVQIGSQGSPVQCMRCFARTG